MDRLPPLAPAPLAPAPLAVDAMPPTFTSPPIQMPPIPMTLSLRLGPSIAVAVALCVSWGTSVTGWAEKPLPTEFLTRHCGDCHGDGGDEGGFELSQLSTQLEDERSFALWERIHDRVLTGEMPPPDATQPERAELEGFVGTLAAALRVSHADERGTVLRRLNRREYENTMNDLFGTRLDLAVTLPEDGRSHEFDNVGRALNMSLVQLQAYLDSAKRVLDRSIVHEIAVPPRETVSANYADMRGADKFLGKQWLKLDDNAVVFFRKLGYPTGMLREATARRDGLYKVRVKGYAYQSERPITFSIGATTFARGAEKPTFGYYSMPPGDPTTVEIEVWLKDRYMIQIEPYGISDDYEIKRNGIENYRGPGLAILHVEVEGPITREYPSRGHRLIFDGVDRRELMPGNPNDRTRSWYKPKFEVRTADAVKEAEVVLRRVTNEAFRRPVTDEDVRPYVDLMRQQMDDGASFEEAIRVAITAIFCSPDFLYFRERSGPLDDHAVATRLSYFLSRTTPDDALRSAAARGELANGGDALAEQAERLLSDPRIDRFYRDFCDAWLDLRNIDFTNPDRSLYPEFDPYLQFSMLAESRAFLQKLVDDNLPVRSLVSPGFAMLNDRLAEHYEVAGVDGPELRAVALDANHVRGGLLGQASVLKVSANGTNTSPVVRGVWVMERIIGQSPPPPPPGIAGVEPDIRGAATLRELLDKHRDSDTCRACHQLIDPPGFALESFNPIGGWRDRFRSLGSGDRVTKIVHGNKVRYRLGQPVDASSELPGGEKFPGFVEFRDHLANQESQLTTSFVTKLLTFATGREMGFSDRAEIARITRESQANGSGIRDLIHLITQSSIFLQN